MNRRHVRWLALAALVVAAAGLPGTTQAGQSSENLLELAGRAGPSVGLGFGVSRLHWQAIAPPQIPGSTPAENGARPDLDPLARAVSLDVKLAWPTADRPGGFEPYATIGPAVFVDWPQEVYGLLGAPGDPLLRVGAKVGAGFNWRLSKDLTLFGSYDITTTTFDGLTSPGVKAPAASAPAYDALYGIRLRY